MTTKDPLRAPIADVTPHWSPKRRLLWMLRRRLVIRHLSMREYVRHRCIFVHVPKAAGLSVCHSLFGHRAGAHMTFREYRSLFETVYREKAFDDFFSFTFVRNTWDRLHSAYTFMRQGGVLPQDEQFADRHLRRFDSFREFVLEWLTPENAYLAPHFSPQTYFLVDTDGEIGPTFLGRFERLDEDYETIRARLGFGGPLQKRNVTSGRGRYVDAYDDETRDHVARVYAEDIERLGCTFG